MLSLTLLVAALAGAETTARPPQDTLPRGPMPAGADTLPVYRLPGLQVEVFRTPVSAARTPGAVSILGSREIRPLGRAGIFMQEALQAVPGLQVQNRFNDAVGERISVRGFGARAQFGIRGIRTVVDGIPATLPDGQATLDHLDLGSLGRMELLRGPGSSLYGTASGGVLLLETWRPTEEGWGLEVRGQGGSWDTYRGQGAVWGRRGESHFVADVYATGYEGFRTDVASEDGTYGTSNKLRVNLTGSTPLAGGSLSGVLNVLDMDAENPGSLSDSLLSLGDRRAYPFNVRQRTDKQVLQGQVGLRWTRSWTRWDGEVAAWGVGRNLENRIPSDLITLDRLAGGIRGAATYRWGDSRPLTLHGGLEAQMQRDDRENFENNQGEAGALTLAQVENVANTAAFARVAWDVHPTLSLTGSLRWDGYRYEADDRFVTGEDPDDSGSRNLQNLSPALGVFWEALGGIGIFGNVSSFFDVPTTTELANRPDGSGGFNPDLDPSSGVAWEAGVRLFDRPTWGGEFSVFLADGRDELVPFEVASAPGRTFFRNAGRSRRKGVEMGLWVAPAEWLELRGSYTHVDARFRDYEVDGEDLSGNRIPGLTPNLVDLVAEGRWRGGRLGLRGLWSDRVYVDDGNQARPSDSYVILDLRGGWEIQVPGGNAVDVYGGVTNLLDETYVSSVVVNAFGRRYYEPGPERGAYLGVAWRWDSRSPR